MYYTFRQNNTHGYYQINDKLGTQVIVEAPTLEIAIERAKTEAGLYFDGKGDCSCCGHRWYAPYEGSEDHIGETPQYYKGYLSESIRIYHMDGTIEQIECPPF